MVNYKSIVFILTEPRITLSTFYFNAYLKYTAKEGTNMVIKCRLLGNSLKKNDKLFGS